MITDLDRFPFVRELTQPQCRVFLPELSLRLASNLIEVWEGMETALDESNTDAPFWAFTWAGGEALARFVLDRPSVVAERRVLDFASGCGVAGIAAALAGARSVCCVDIDPIAAVCADENAALNEVSVNTSVADIVGSTDLEYDVVLAGDICYEKTTAERVASWLQELATRGVVVLLGDPGRRYLPANGLEESARYCVPTTSELEDTGSKDTVVWTVVDGAGRRRAGS